MKRVGMISGGSGSSKFATAFSDYSKENSGFNLGIIPNVADNYWYHGMYVCPDVDIITHALAGNLDISKGWGVDSDTYVGKGVFSKLSNSTEWFTLGDSEFALCQRRTELMKMGWKLSSITYHFCRALQIEQPILPATDDRVMTFVRTTAGLMHLQQYWVKYQANPKANGIIYAGSDTAEADHAAVSFLTDYAILSPANPVTSILPTLRLKNVEKTLRKSHVLAISPFIGNEAFSGPAAKMMSVIGVEPSSFGVASLYSSFLKLFIVDTMEESQIVSRIKDLGIECVKTNTRIEKNSKQSIAKEIMNLL